MKNISLFISEYRAYLILAVAVWVVMFLISPDSYTHHLFGRDDSAIFFTSGKALMNGMVPYVDYADSKGPLLWLIYGVGYLLSHYDYTGVFWLSWMAYSVTLAYLFRLACLFLKDNRLALLATLAMIGFLFCSWYHYEVKSEDWCQPFIVATLFHFCRLFYGDGKKQPEKAFLVFGISFSACLLIKFSVAAMLASVWVYGVIHLLRHHSRVVKPIFWSAAGALCTLLPFIVWLSCIGALDAFIREYFVNTVFTIRDSAYQDSYLHELIYSIGISERLTLFIVGMAGCMGIALTQKLGRLFLPFVLLCFWAITIHHATFHYFITCSSFSLFFILCIIRTYRDVISRHYTQFITSVPSAVVLLLLLTCCFRMGYLDNTLRFVHSDYLEDEQEVYRLTSATGHQPTMIFYKAIDRGDGIKADALPGSTYWTTQMGATQEMNEQQYQDIRNKKADWIMTESLDSVQLEQQIRWLQGCGYTTAYRFKAKDKWGLMRVLLKKFDFGE